MKIAGDGERLVYVVGPSGAGKDAVLAGWRDHLGDGAPVHFARRLITRPEAAGGERHEGIDVAGLEALRRDGALALHWQANGLHYGVRHACLQPLARGEWVVVNGSRGHLQALRDRAPRARVVLVTASPAVLAARLRQRGREADGEVAARLARNDRLAGEARAADLVILNEGPLGDAVAALDRWWRTHARGLQAG